MLIQRQHRGNGRGKQQLSSSSLLFPVSTVSTGSPYYFFWAKQNIFNPLYRNPNEYSTSVLLRQHITILVQPRLSILWITCLKIIEFDDFVEVIIRVLDLIRLMVGGKAVKMTMVVVVVGRRKTYCSYRRNQGMIWKCGWMLKSSYFLRIRLSSTQ